MKTTALITLILTILGLGLAWWGAEGIVSNTQRITEAQALAESASNRQDHESTRLGMMEIWVSLKSIRLYEALLSAGLLIAVPSSIASLVLQILSLRRESRSKHRVHQNPSVPSAS